MSEMDCWQLALWEWLVRFSAAIWFGFEWPHAVFFIFLGTVVAFRRELRAIFPRIVELGPQRIVLRDQIPTDVQLEPVDRAAHTFLSAAPINAAWPAGTIPPPPVAAEYPNIYRKVADFIGADLARLDDSRKMQYLREHLLATRVLFIFENIYAHIFGGQIDLLRYLNERTTFGASREEVEALWVTHQQQNKPALDQWDSNGYLVFLKHRELIVEENGRVLITPSGTDFLVWIVRNARQERLW